MTVLLSSPKIQSGLFKVSNSSGLEWIKVEMFKFQNTRIYKSYNFLLMENLQSRIAVCNQKGGVEKSAITVPPAEQGVPKRKVPSAGPSVSVTFSKLSI